jgi:hypothetical protein
MREIAFSSFKEIAERSKGKSIVLFGAGNIAAKTARRVNREFSIVDNNPNLWGAERIGVIVQEPVFFKSHEQADFFIIICTTSFIEVSELLKEMGYTVGEDFIVSPILNDLRIISEIEDCRKRMLFTSGSPEQNSLHYGGGIYELELDGDIWEYKKVYSGICYGLMRYGENFITVDDKLGIIEFDSEFNIIRSKSLKEGTRGHGIAFSDVTQCFYIASSDLDRVLIFDKNFDEINSVSFSNKCETEGEHCHHCNDVCVVGHSLYVSMFSLTGNWKRDIFDGVVLEIDIDTLKIRGPVISNLWMPHNISFFDGCLVVLESLKGHLRKHNAQVIGEFPGFTRGLAFDGIHFCIGQSRNRNYSKYLGLSKNISIDTSIIIFDEETKVSRSLQLPSKLSEIHSILLL